MPEKLTTTWDKMQDIRGQKLCPAAMDLALRVNFQVKDGIALILENPALATKEYAEEDFRKVFLAQRDNCASPTLAINTILPTAEGFLAFIESNQIAGGTCVAKIPFSLPKKVQSQHL